MDQMFRNVIALGLMLVIAVAGLILLPQPTGAARLGNTASSPVQQEGNMPDIVDTAIAAENFTTLVAALQAANLVDALRGEGPFTVFAPTDDAFAALPAGTVEALLQDPEGALTEVLLYHVIAGQVMAADLTDGLTAETLQGGTVTFTIADDTTKVNDANITVTDIETTNGVIHVIDAVLLPPEAPGPAAEDVAPETQQDTSDQDVTDDDQGQDIVDTAIAAENFTTLVAALQAANLVDALRSEGPFTVFAPTDEAFAALPAGTVDTLLQDPEGALTEILLYHVIAGQVMAADLTDGLTAETLQGGTVTFTIADDTAKVNEANIIVTDIETTNGFIHVIDAVILPPEAPDPTAAAAASGASAGAHAVDDDDDDDDRSDRKRGRHYGKGHYGKHYYDRHHSQRYWHHGGKRHHGQRGHYSGHRGQRRGWRGHR